MKKEKQQQRDKEKGKKKVKTNSDEYSESGQSNSPVKQHMSPIILDDDSDIKAKDSLKNEDLLM